MKNINRKIKDFLYGFIFTSGCILVALVADYQLDKPFVERGWDGECINVLHEFYTCDTLPEQYKEVKK